jgi:hypothetical protein
MQYACTVLSSRPALSYKQRYILRDRRPSTAACPAMGTKELKYVVCGVPTRAAKAEQKSLELARQAQRTNQSRTPFICTL